MSKNLSGIYEISFKNCDKKYIGSSIYLGKRIKDHLWALKNNCHINKDLQQAFITYGTENTYIKILEYVDNDEFLSGLLDKKQFQNILFNLEQLYLDKFYAQEYINNSKDIRFFKLLFNKSVLARYALTENNKSKEVYKYNLNGEYIENFYNSQVAEACTGVDSSSIRRNCQKKRKSAGGFIWSYQKESIITYKRGDEKRIFQYKETELINSFFSIAEAFRVTKIDVRKGNSNHFTSQGGFYWLYEEENIIDYIKQRKRKYKQS